MEKIIKTNGNADFAFAEQFVFVSGARSIAAVRTFCVYIVKDISWRMWREMSVDALPSTICYRESLNLFKIYGILPTCAECMPQRIEFLLA